LTGAGFRDVIGTKKLTREKRDATAHMLTTKRAIILAAALVAATLIAGVLAWPSLPDAMTTHWNAAGEPNGVSSKAFGVLFVPLLAAALATLLFWLPEIDPIEAGFKTFRKEYDGLVLMIVAFMSVVHGMVLAWNLGTRVDFIHILGPGIGLLCFYLGTIMPRMKRNHFAGIRTPWTLSSDRVWDETHRHGGQLFRLSGVLAGFGAFFPEYALLLILVPMILTSLWVTIYSYIVFRRKA